MAALGRWPGQHVTASEVLQCERWPELESDTSKQRVESVALTVGALVLELLAS